MSVIESYVVVDECGIVRFISFGAMSVLSAVYKYLGINLDLNVEIANLEILLNKGEIALKQPNKEPIRVVRQTIERWRYL